MGARSIALTLYTSTEMIFKVCRKSSSRPLLWRLRTLVGHPHRSSDNLLLEPYNQPPSLEHTMGFAARLQEAKTHEDAQKGPVSASVASDVITAALSKAVIDNGLSALYPLGGPRLAKILAQLGETFNMAAFCQRFRIPPLIAGDLMQVALYDVQLFIDDSGSMNESDKWDDARAIVNQIVQITTQFDLDGIDVEFMNSPISGKRLKTSEEVTALFDQVWRFVVFDHRMRRSCNRHSCSILCC